MKDIEHLVADINHDETLRHESQRLLQAAGQTETAVHTLSVTGHAVTLARQFGVDPRAAEMAALLHDVSKIWSPERHLEIAPALGIEVLVEERQAPFLLHQKVSAALARVVFGITEPSIISAIGCHTTLKPNPSILDALVLVADKLSWDSSSAPFKEMMERELEASIFGSALVYLEYMYERRHHGPALHPWLASAYHELAGR